MQVAARDDKKAKDEARKPQAESQVDKAIEKAKERAARRLSCKTSASVDDEKEAAQINSEAARKQRPFRAQDAMLDVLDGTVLGGAGRPHG